MLLVSRYYGMGLAAAGVACMFAIALESPAYATHGAVTAIALAAGAVIIFAMVSIMASGMEAKGNAPASTLADPITGAAAPFHETEHPEEAAFRVAQATHVFGQLRLMMAITIANGILVAVALAATANRAHMLGWLTLIIGLSALGWWAGRGRGEQPAPTRISKRTLRRIALHSGIRGAVWGLCFALFFGSVGTSGQHVLLTVSLGMSAGGVTALAPVPAAALLYGLGVLVPTVLRLATMGGLDHLLLAGLGIMFWGTMVMVGAQMYRAFAGSFLSQREHAEQSATISLLLNEFEQSASDWLWETDERGRLVHVSPRMADVLGLDRNAAEMASLTDVLARTQGAAMAEITAHMDAKASFRDIVATCVGKDGCARWIAFTASPNPGGGYRGVGRDITAERRAREDAELAQLRSEQAEQRLKDGIASLGAAFVLTDKSDRIVLTNRGFDALFPAVAQSGSDATLSSRIAAQAGAWVPSRDGVGADWQSRLMENRAADADAVDVQLPDGRWLRCESRPTSENGLVTILTDISDIKEQEAALERTARRLEESNRELQQFATIASHDLQEPLRKIEAFGSRLSARAGSALDEDSKQFLDRMLTSTQRMRRLITDLLEYSRVTRRTRAPEAVDLDHVVGDVLDDLSIAASEKRAVIEVGQLGRAMATPTQLRQLFQNLISNALKFTRPDIAPHITIRVGARRGGMVEILVADNGIGFDMRHHDKIFEIFQRLHGRDEYEGTGVGLATCRRIVEQFGGTLRAESVPGTGTTFHIMLPGETRGSDQGVDIASAA